MRPNSNQRRGRGRAGRRPNIPARAQTYDSNGPGGRIRGNATQVYEKYAASARDAMAAGDRVLAEALNQYAEHYYRIVNDSTDPEPLRPPAPPREEADSGAERAEGAEASAPSGEAPAQPPQDEQAGQQRRSRRRPRNPGADVDGGEAIAPQRAERPEDGGRDRVRADGEGERPEAEDEGLRKMLSASAGREGGAAPRRRKANGAGEPQAADAEAGEPTVAESDPAKPDEQPEPTPESV